MCFTHIRFIVCHYFLQIQWLCIPLTHFIVFCFIYAFYLRILSFSGYKINMLFGFFSFERKDLYKFNKYIKQLLNRIPYKLTSFFGVNFFLFSSSLKPLNKSLETILIICLFLPSEVLSNFNKINSFLCDDSYFHFSICYKFYMRWIVSPTTVNHINLTLLIWGHLYIGRNLRSRSYFMLMF